MRDAPGAAERRSRRRFWVAGLFVAGVAGAALLLPVWLLTTAPEPARFDEPATQAAVGAVARDVARVSRTPATAPAAPAPEPSAVSAADVAAPPSAISASRPQPAVASAPPATPTTTSAAPTTAPNPDEWDRSQNKRERAVERFGGTPLTESAVESGLAWLAAHQSPDGTWDRIHFDRQCPAEDRCTGAALKRANDELTAGTTGLALLAFLGAGYTDQTGPYPVVVQRAVAALLRCQRPHGGFSATDSMAGYNDALATLALAEYYALSNDPQVAEPLGRAVQRIIGGQQSRGGWDYLPTPTSGRNDSSISAWMVQALHACAATGVPVPRRRLVRAALYFSQAVERDGRVRYADAGSGFRLDDNLRPVFQHGVGMLAAGLTCEQMLGWRTDSTMPLKQRSLVLAELPDAGKARGRDPSGFHNEYYWYYGTLAMFQRGGADWQKWNHRLRDAVLPLQNREKLAHGAKKHAFGSWPAYGPNWGVFGQMGGRVYATAICTLTLEIYYRHTPAFLAEAPLFSADDWFDALAEAPPVERLRAIECVGQLRLEIGEPVLVEFLKDGDRSVALGAAEALAWLDSPMGVPVIEAVVTTLPPWQRGMLEQALERAKGLASLPGETGEVRLYDPQTRRGTVELSRSYVGQELGIERAGQRIGRLRVVQRFSGRNIAVVELLGDAVDPPRAGDRVRGGE